MSSYVYKKIPNFTYQGAQVYYKQPVSNSLIQAREFSAYYNYYYIFSSTKDEKFLGKFKGMRMRDSGRREDDYSYQIYEFENGEIPIDEIKQIYCRNIPCSDENMILIPELAYETMPVFYKRE
jgi:hypothetical protein